jgi:hypothetical protein
MGLPAGRSGRRLPVRLGRFPRALGPAPHRPAARTACQRSNHLGRRPARRAQPSASSRRLPERLAAALGPLGRVPRPALGRAARSRAGRGAARRPRGGRSRPGAPRGPGRRGRAVGPEPGGGHRAAAGGGPGPPGRAPDPPGRGRQPAPAQVAGRGRAGRGRDRGRRPGRRPRRAVQPRPPQGLVQPDRGAVDARLARARLDKQLAAARHQGGERGPRAHPPGRGPHPDRWRGGRGVRSGDRAERRDHHGHRGQGAGAVAVAVVAGRAGWTIDRAGAAAALLAVAAAPTGTTVTLPVTERPPTVGADAARAAADRATRLPHLAGRGDAGGGSARLGPADLAPLVRARVAAGQLQLRLDPAGLDRLLRRDGPLRLHRAEGRPLPADRLHGPDPPGAAGLEVVPAKAPPPCSRPAPAARRPVGGPAHHGHPAQADHQGGQGPRRQGGDVDLHRPPSTPATSPRVHNISLIAAAVHGAWSAPARSSR